MSHQPAEPAEVDARLGLAWREDRRYVLGVALRMLGDLADAEDVVQEAFSRLLRRDIGELDDVRGWLVTVVSRLCLDQLRSARRQRQQPLPAPGDPPPPGRAPVPATGIERGDPGDRVTLDDGVRLALQVVLQRLSPAERTAFVLHDVFGLSFDDVAEAVGRSPAACRQLASRARRHIHDDADPARFVIEPSQQRDAAEQFVSACSTGDLDALLAVLDPDVAGQFDLGGRSGRRPPVVGSGRVGRAAILFLGPDSGVTLLSLPGGRPSVLAVRDGRPTALVSLTVRGGLVHHIDGSADPVLLATVAAALSR